MSWLEFDGYKRPFNWTAKKGVGSNFWNPTQLSRPIWLIETDPFLLIRIWSAELFKPDFSVILYSIGIHRAPRP
jgi:hypothetical protein